MLFEKPFMSLWHVYLRELVFSKRVRNSIVFLELNCADKKLYQIIYLTLYLLTIFSQVLDMYKEYQFEFRNGVYLKK